jgi:hypothetical protein
MVILEDGSAGFIVGVKAGRGKSGDGRAANPKFCNGHPKPRLAHILERTEPAPTAAGRG